MNKKIYLIKNQQNKLWKILISSMKINFDKHREELSKKLLRNWVKENIERKQKSQFVLLPVIIEILYSQLNGGMSFPFW